MDGRKAKYTCKMRKHFLGLARADDPNAGDGFERCEVIVAGKTLIACGVNRCMIFNNDCITSTPAAVFPISTHTSLPQVGQQYGKDGIGEAVSKLD